MIIDGKKIAEKIYANLKKKTGITPSLAIILVGNDPASISYVRQKELRAKEIGIKTTIINLDSRIQNSELLKIIRDLNLDSSIRGIIVQQPLPSQINIRKITQAIDPKKDVDGFHLKTGFQMPIAMAVFEVLKETFIHLRGGVAPTAHLEGEFREWLKNKNIVVIGKGETGGKPIIDCFKMMGIKISVIDSKTQNPSSITKSADIIISAVGKPNVVKPEMIKRGVILIGVGLHKEKDNKLHGDYEENYIKDIASFYTPTPGGVGPLNVAMLLKNVIKSNRMFLAVDRE